MSDDLNQRSYRDALTGYHNPPVFLKTNPFNLPHSNDGLYTACLRIMAKVHELDLDLELDSKTPGDGACFFWAVLQQLRRKEIYPLLRPDLKELVDTNDAATLRMRVCNFELHSPVIQQNKKDLIYDTDGETWDEYWKNMKKVSEWASGAVLRTAAVYLQMNINLVETVICHKKAPLMTSYGTFDATRSSACVDLFIGLDHDFHFQSLLPTTPANSPQKIPSDDTGPTASTSSSILTATALSPAISPAEILASTKNLKESAFALPKAHSKKTPTAKNDSAIQTSNFWTPLEDTEDNLPTKCPACSGEFPKLLAHLRNKVCKDKLGEKAINDLRLQFHKQSVRNKSSKYQNTDKAAESQRKYQQTVKGAESQRKYQQTDKGAERQRKYQQTEKGAERRKKYQQTDKGSKSQKKSQKNSFDLARDDDYQGVKLSQNTRKTVERTRKRQASEDKCAELVQAAKRLKLTAAVVTESDRLCNFQKATLTGPDFWCVSCQKGFFETQVKPMTEKLLDKIDEKLSRDSWLHDPNVFTKVKIEKGSQRVPASYKMSPVYENERYLCKLCTDSLTIKGRMSHSCVKNNLELHDTDQQLRDQDLECTELEGALCAKSLLFQKIILLVKSRWTGLIDKIVNVPITDEALNDVFTQLPRLPKDSGMVTAVLKRKLKFKNSHKKQLVNPDRMCRLLAKLNASGNPHYSNVDTPDQYKARCEAEDESGYDLLYGDDPDELLEALEELSQLPPDNMVTDEVLPNGDENGTEDDVEARENHPLQKDQCEYDQITFLTDKSPEISVAPGEGGTPKSILTDKHVDVKAFPHLHNADGSNGMHQDRPVPGLTDQKYLIQRMLNREKRFSNSPAYLYFAVYFLELKRMYSNIALVGTRGRRKETNTGSVSYELRDVHRVVEKVPNTHAYWKTAKYEMICKLENEGPFQVRLFFPTFDIIFILSYLRSFGLSHVLIFDGTQILPPFCWTEATVLTSPTLKRVDILSLSMRLVMPMESGSP